MTAGRPQAEACAAVPAADARLYGLLALMLLFWSANFVFAKFALNELPAMLVICLRIVLSGVLMGPVYALAIDGDSAPERWTKRDAPLLAALGLLGVVLNQMLFVVGLSRTTVAHGAVISAMSPILVMIGASLSGQEHLSRRKLAGVVVALCGVAGLQLGKAQAGRASMAGDLLLLASSMAFAAFTVFGKRTMARFGSLAVNLFAYTGGAVLLLPLAIWELSRHDVSQASGAAWLGIVYMAIFPGIAGYLIYSHALRYLPATRVSSVTYLQPVLATLLAIAVLGERPGPGFVVGGALVLGGLFIAERS
jgi:drug/metabolite transporter (DMT)-like permease